MANNSRTVRKEIMYALWFVVGFIVCYFIFVILPPYVTQKGEISSTTEQRVPESMDDFITLVEYTDSGFKPKAVTIRKGNYIIIRNMSQKSYMWLSSENIVLRTTRGYAQSEQIKTVLNDVGAFTVSNTFNVSHKLSVIVR